ncbi:hypothetical protein R3P38DRAFT_2563600 [Favolaschia claudopus]|uniref:Uncharacterized protein n=1 Tax=Favolaschia claudopus TaxID=2862362 RepID=A0AAW0A1B7_9AGAR
MANSSRSSSPTPFNSDEEDDYSKLMSTRTPVSSPTRKRTADDADFDSEPPSDALTVLPRSNGNHLQSIMTYATRKRLRPEQVAEVETFVADPIPVQLAKLFVSVKANENALAKLHPAKAKFEPNADLKTNLTRAVNATLCSASVTQYRGEAAKNDIQTMLMRYRWGNFVAGTEHDQAAMDTIHKFIGDVLTQSRSTIKKEIVKSVETLKTAKTKNDTPSLRPKSAHTTIFQLTKILVTKLSGGKAIAIPITAALCARVALMRKWHVKMVKGKVDAEDKRLTLWELIDKDLQKIRAQAREETEADPGEIAKRVARAFVGILDSDRKNHGSDPNEQIPDVNVSTDAAVISYQAEVDETIEARSRGHTVSGGVNPEEGDDKENDEESL